MNNVYLLYGFNSYHNRILKRYDNLSDYPVGSGDKFDIISNCNFSYRDGVTTTVVQNIANQNIDYNESPNYALVVDSSNNILSRWYIVDGNKTRGGQYQLTLLRDGIADYFDDIKNAPMYIEKGMLSIDDKPFIYNKEQIDFNQIKTSETLLKDRTECPWIIGFMAQQQPEGTSDPFTTTVTTNAYNIPDATYSSMSDYPYWSYLLSDPYTYTNNTYFKTFGVYNNPTTLSIQIAYTSGSETPSRNVVLTYLYTPQSGWVYYNNCIINNQQHLQPWRSAAFAYNGTLDTLKIADLATRILNLLNNNSAIATDCEAYVVAYGTDIKSRAQYEAFRAEAGKVIKTNNSATQSSGEVYPASMYVVGTPTTVSSDIFGQTIDPVGDYLGMAYCGGINHSSQLYTDLLSIFNSNLSYLNLVYRGQYGVADLAQNGILAQTSMNNVGTGQISFAFTGTEKGLVDAPYRMFCMPYNDNAVKWLNNGGNYITSNKGVNMGVAQGIASTFSGTWLYDLQLVPFCPLVKSDKITINNNGEVIINVQSMTLNKDYSRITNAASAEIAYLLWCETSQIDNYQIPYTVNAGSTAIDKKVNNQCDMYRLSSPSYNSIYEFSAEYNNGINGFDVDLVYKPMDSYVHVNPNWGGLYIGEGATDFNDARGLVFTGPFSLPQTTSAWMQYKMNNMNYQNSFDRRVSGEDSYMAKMHKYDMAEQITKGALGVAQGAVSGAAAGAAGGGIGMAVGALVGAGVSAVSAEADRQLSELRYTESINYEVDQFNYSLQNVQAQAQTLAKVSSFTPNNKVFPILEYYTCTQSEKDAFKEKLKYNGMTVNKIGRLNTFYTTWPTDDEQKRYTKGKLIRLNVDEDNHLIEHITEELNKGVFI